MEFETELAQKLVRTSLRINPDEEVLIDTWAHTIGLAEAITLECYRVGAIPAIHLITDNLFRSMLSEIPEQNLSKTPKHLLSAYDSVAATIDLGGPQDPKVFEAGSPKKQSAVSQAFKPLWDKARQNKIRGAFVALGTCTPERAKTYGVDYNRWREAMIAALSVDFDELAAAGKELASVLEDGEMVYITAPEGTDFTFQLGKRRVTIEDGIIDENDLQKGARWTDLPTGYVGVAPLEISANGTIVFPSVPLWGKLIKNLRWTFKNGRLVEFDADQHGEVFGDFLAGGSGDKDRIASFSIGINPKAKPVSAGLMDSIAQGAVAIGVGNNLDFGGKNDSTFYWSGTLLGARVEVDDKPLLGGRA